MVATFGQIQDLDPTSFQPKWATMELKTYLVILWRRKWIIAVTVIVTMVVAVAGTMMITPTYQASATLRIAVDNSSVSYGDLLYTQRMMNTFPTVVKSDSMMIELKEYLKTGKTPASVEVIFPAESELVLITVEDEDPIFAANAANGLAELFVPKVKETKVGRGFSISLVDLATPPQSPASPNIKLNLVLGMMVGLASGLGLAFLFEHLDTTLYTDEEIEETVGCEILAKVPTFKCKQGTVLLNGNSPQREAFRRLQTNIFRPNQIEILRTLLVTSAEPGEGKSTTVANLAFTIAQSGRKVVVVDGDLRLPILHKVFGLPNSIGLSNVLQGEVTWNEVVQESEIPGVYVITSGSSLHNSAERLGLLDMSTLLEELRHQFDMVLLDTPALLPVVDAAIIASQVDGVLLVVGKNQIRKEDLQAVRRQLRHSQAKLIGAVVNRTKWDRRYSRYYHS